MWYNDTTLCIYRQNCKSQASFYVFLFQVSKFCQDILKSISSRQVFQNTGYWITEASDTWLAMTDKGVNCDAFQIFILVHDPSLFIRGKNIKNKRAVPGKYIFNYLQRYTLIMVFN